MNWADTMFSWYAMQNEIVETVFVQCRQCGRKQEMDGTFQPYQVTDKQAVEYFKRKGWDMKKLTCRKCTKAKRRESLR